MKKKMFMRCMALFLSLAVLASANSTEVFAQTISENKMLEEETDSLQEENKVAEEAALEEISKEAVQSTDSMMEDIIEGSTVSENSKVLAGGVSAPVHYCTKDGSVTDKTTWSYVYFGSYPQTEVTDSDLISRIDAAVESYGTAGNAGMDVWINGIKYRRIGKKDVQNSTNFGTGEYHYFQWERIRWRILKKDDNEMFLMADMNLDCQKYNETSTDTSWESCSVRNWLNGSFYQTAFSSEERAAIIESTNKNGANEKYGVEGCADTKDKVFFLSIDEATNPEYGFCDIEADWGGYEISNSRTVKTSDYSLTRGTSDFEGASWYWLRTVGQEKSYAVTIQWETGTSLFGNGVAITYIGTCPALRINCNSDMWTTTDDHTSGTGGEDAGNENELKCIQAEKAKTDYRVGETLNLDDLIVKAVYARIEDKQLERTEYEVDASLVDMNTIGIYPLKISYNGKSAQINISVSKAGMPTDPVHYCKNNGNETDTTKWHYVSLGSYPQTKVTDEKLIQSIESAIAALQDKTGECLDVEINGEKYRRLTQNGTENTYSYFKWEPINWRVLSNDGTEMFLLADKALDSSAYHNQATDVTWESSSIRTWLNESFYQTAFTEREKEALVKHTVVNGANSYTNISGGNNTEDFVCLLSLDEIRNSEYGFCNISSGSDTRKLEPTEYVKELGVNMEESSKEGEKDSCTWWLRTPGDAANKAVFVLSPGLIFPAGFDVSKTQIGIRPALYLKVSSDVWEYVESEEGKKEEGNNGESTDTDPSKEQGNSTDPGNSENSEGTINQKVTKLKITGPSTKLAAGKKVKLTLKVTPSNAANKSVTWKTSNKKYATVTQSGKITIKKAGIGKTVTITATAKDGSGVKAKFKFKIMKHSVKSIKIKAPSKTLKAGKSMTLKTTIKTTGKKVNKTLKWTTSNKKYATVNSKGKVTAKKAGKGKTVTITATSTDGSNKKAKVKIKIK